MKALRLEQVSRPGRAPGPYARGHGEVTGRHHRSSSDWQWPGTDPILTGSLGSRLVEDLYLIAHHPDSGRAQLNNVALGVGVVAALLVAEVDCGRAVLRAGLVQSTNNGQAHGPAGRFADALRWSAPAEPQVWLRALAGEAAGWVRDDLIEQGVLARPEPSWRCWWPAVQSVDPTEAERRSVLARNRLRPGAETAASDVVLAGLVQAIGLHRWWLRDYPDLHGPLRALVRGLPPELFDLLGLVEHAVSSRALAPRA
ncbi:GPP34 family phosphoprotein [Longispora sp. NPDC051575]|uniref:GPP34 family phosphoprotein n=1 Tax=Longispora sp. NPDC051575 TaxID=3154943 RepID=UPI003418F145